MEREGILTWDYYINRFSSIFAGGNYEKAGDEEETASTVDGTPSGPGGRSAVFPLHGKAPDATSQLHPSDLTGIHFG